MADNNIDYRAKIYTEKLPRKERTFFGVYRCPLNAEYVLSRWKYFIFTNAYPKRPLPETLSISVGQANDHYEAVIELIFSDAMKLQDKMEDNFNREWWFDSIVEALENIREMIQLVPSACELLKENSGEK